MMELVEPRTRPCTARIYPPQKMTVGAWKVNRTRFTGHGYEKTWRGPAIARRQSSDVLISFAIPFSGNGIGYDLHKKVSRCRNLDFPYFLRNEMIFGNEILKSALVKGKLPNTTSFRMGAICKKTSICKMASLNARCFNLLVLHFEHFCVERPQRKCRSSKRPGLTEAKSIPTCYVCISNYFEYFRMGTILLNMSIIIRFSNENYGLTGAQKNVSIY